MTESNFHWISQNKIEPFWAEFVTISSRRSHGTWQRLRVRFFGLVVTGKMAGWRLGRGGPGWMMVARQRPACSSACWMAGRWLLGQNGWALKTPHIGHIWQPGGVQGVPINALNRNGGEFSFWNRNAGQVTSTAIKLHSTFLRSFVLFLFFFSWKSGDFLFLENVIE